ncbi:MAG: hypothetical protein KDC45_15100 [Bacteroidetes bacterium]|nr:hypothetical protein [Bacteroidota bacterium]
MILRSVFTWIILLLLAIANGSLRTFVIAPQVGDLRGHQISTVLLCSLIGTLSWLTISWIKPSRAGHAWLVGGLWVLLTLAFEFLAGHYLFGNSWEKLLFDYQLFSGRIWILALITTFVSPYIAATSKGLIANH